MSNIKNGIKEKIMGETKKWKYATKKKELNNGTYLD